jgi:hypothetical protein
MNKAAAWPSLVQAIMYVPHMRATASAQGIRESWCHHDGMARVVPLPGRANPEKPAGHAAHQAADALPRGAAARAKSRKQPTQSRPDLALGPIKNSSWQRPRNMHHCQHDMVRQSGSVSVNSAPGMGPAGPGRLTDFGMGG